MNIDLFASTFRTQFGFPVGFLKYKIEEFDSRIKDLEEKWDNVVPVMGASIAKNEAIINTMSLKDKSFAINVNRETERLIISSSPNETLIESYRI